MKHMRPGLDDNSHPSHCGPLQRRGGPFSTHTRGLTAYVCIAGLRVLGVISGVACQHPKRPVLGTRGRRARVGDVARVGSRPSVHAHHHCHDSCGFKGG